MDWLRGKLAGKDPEFGPRVVWVSPKVSVKIYFHRAHRVPCWTYVTSGLRQFDHAEVVFELQRLPGESQHPHEPLSLVGMVEKFIGEGEQFVPGAHFALKFTGPFLGRRDFAGLLFVPYLAGDHVGAPDSAVAGIMLVGPEYEMLESEGPSRQLARFSERTRYYPYPTWFDRRRPVWSSPQLSKGSVLSQGCPGASLWEATLLMEGRQLQLRLPSRAVPFFDEQLGELPDDAPFSLYPGVDPTADGCLTWRTGQTEPAGVTLGTGPSYRMAGCFVLLCPGGPEDICRIMEDGFGLGLTASTFARIRGALRAGTDLEVRCDAFDVEITFFPS